MGERAVEELADLEDLPLSIVRPSIIESALFHPVPGWIDGFKMADPIIRAYGLGQIPEFPGIPEGIVDIIPVDMVVNAMLAVAGTPPEPRRPAYYHVSSGSRNPLQYHELYGRCAQYFEAHPLPERGRGEHKVPEWTFPGQPDAWSGCSTAPSKLTDVAEKIVTHMPKSKRDARPGPRVDRDKARVEFVKRYAICTACTPRPRSSTPTIARSRCPSRSRRRTASGSRSTAAMMDWRYYLQDVHSPAVTQSLRELSRRERPDARPSGSSEREQPVVALFDMEGTIITSNVVESYVWTRMADLPPEEWPARARERRSAGCPRYLQIDRRDRGDFLRTFFRRYEGASRRGRPAVDRRARGRVHAPEGQRRRDPPDPRTSRGRSPHDPHHGGRAEHLRPTAGAAVRHRDRRASSRCVTADIPGSWPRRHSSVRRAPRGCVATRTRRASTSNSRTRTRTRTPTSRCCGPWATRWPCLRTPSLYRYARRRRWPIEPWAMSKGMPRVRFPRPAADDVSRCGGGGGLMALALELFRIGAAVPRGARGRHGRLPGWWRGRSRRSACANARPRRRGEGWTRVRPMLSGICGSDLATLAGQVSFYFSPLVSMPFVPGHEVVGSCSTTRRASPPATGSCCRAS